VFAPQKGADAGQVRVLRERLAELAARYESELGVDVTGLAGGGAAGGLAGGLAAVGAELVPGFALVADALGLDDAIAGADLVVTGEGLVDTTSFAGKVVGGVLERAAALGVAAAVVAGAVAEGLPVRPVPVWSLTERFGAERAWHEAAACLTALVASELAV